MTTNQTERNSTQPCWNYLNLALAKKKKLKLEIFTFPVSPSGEELQCYSNTDKNQMDGLFILAFSNT